MRRVIATLVVTAVALIAVLSYRSPKVRLTGTQTLSNTTTSQSPVRSRVTTTAPESVTTSSVPVTTPPSRIAYFSGPPIKAVQPGDAWVFGVVEVEIETRASRIIDVEATTLPPTGDTGGPGTRPTTTSISNYAAPILRSEALRAQGDSIATVSGATYTSDAFRQSLLAALRASSRQRQ